MTSHAAYSEAIARARADHLGAFISIVDDETAGRIAASAPSADTAVAGVVGLSQIRWHHHPRRGGQTVPSRVHEHAQRR